MVESFEISEVIPGTPSQIYEAWERKLREGRKTLS